MIDFIYSHAPFFQTILGKTVLRPAKLDKRLARELKGLADPEDPYETVNGKTLCTNDFYEGQGRLDGAFCDYGEAEKMEYLNKLADFGESEKGGIPRVRSI